MIAIEGVDHLGIRVTDRDRALRFYAQFGFEQIYADSEAPVLIVRNPTGVEINFILNGVTPAGGANVLMDAPEKHPGFTHVALRVESMEGVVRELERAAIPITEGPVRLGDGLSLFVRDPDGNVIELRESKT